MVGLACSTAGCHGVLSPPTSLKSGLISAYDLIYNEQSAFCRICGAILDLTEWESTVRPQLARAKEAFMLSSTCVDDIEECIRQLKQSLDIRGSVLHKHNQLLGETHSRLAELYKITGQLDLAILHQSFALKTAERLYPLNSTNVAFEMLALSVLLQVNNNPEWQLLYQQAYSYLRLHYGSAAAAVVNST